MADIAAQMADGAPRWLQPLRAKGRDGLASLSMPSAKDEVWRYVELGFDLDDFTPATAAGDTIPAGAYLGSLSDRAGSATIIDGFVAAAESRTAGLRVAAMEDGDPAGDRVGTAIDPGLDLFTAAHAAFTPGALVIHAHDNTAVAAPVVVDVQATRDGTACFPHITVALDTNAEASVVIVYRSVDGSPVLQVPQVEAFVGDGSRLRLTTVQTLGAGARSIGNQQVTLGRDASVRLGEVGLGADLARLRLGVDLDGAGSSMNAAGLYFGDRNQVHDYRVFITHRGPSSSSDLFLKGAVEDEAEAVWTGLVRIEHEATGTSAFETNRNLVLSEGAKVNSVPNLEILTDDLQCGHGSSSGPLEEEHLYYLMSRGLHRDRAERLLVRGFFEEIIRDLPTSELAEPTRAAVYEKFVAAQAEGRVL